MVLKPISFLRSKYILDKIAKMQNLVLKLIFLWNFYGKLYISHSFRTILVLYSRCDYTNT